MTALNDAIQELSWLTQYTKNKQDERFAEFRKSSSQSALAFFGPDPEFSVDSLIASTQRMLEEYDRVRETPPAPKRKFKNPFKK